MATNIHTMQKAAVKIINKDALLNDANASNENPDGLSYGIEREIIIMKLLNHPNVLRLYDVWETDKQLYLILEYVEGGELFDLLVESGPLPEATAVNFFKQIILGASYCHNLGICHRDLKPENILLDKDLNIKIADFGMAALESGRLLETSCGSPHYAAPEIVSGLQYHGAESDVWSCGVILFAILTGRLPFDDDNIRDLLLKVQVGKYEIVEDLSKEAIDLISKMLTVDPKERIRTDEILKHPLITKYYNFEEDSSNQQLPITKTTRTLTKSNIDEKILENLVILWHGRSKDSIVKSLLSSEESNPEKTFYSLLLQYRHEHSNDEVSKSGDGLVRSSSIISKVTTSNSNLSNSSSKKRFSFAASSSAKGRPSSFQSSRNSKSINSFSNIPPISGPAYQDYLLKTSTANNSQNSSPGKNILPHSNSNSKSQRNSMIFSSNGSPNKRASIISNLQDLRSPPPAPKVTKLKRNSITSKVLSQYAKMAQYDDSHKNDNTEDVIKRKSADFAQLCDALFTDGSKQNLNIPNSESMATINAIVFGGNNKRQSKRLSMVKQRTITAQTLIPPIEEHHSSSSSPVNANFRNSSDPISKISKILNDNGIDSDKRRIVSEANAPPKPVSKLDPRFKAYSAYEKRVSQDAARLLAEAEARAIQEQRERLEREKIELEALEAKAAEEAKLAEQREQEELAKAQLHSSNTVLRTNRQIPTKLSDVQVPNVARLSKNNKNRYSVLSLYSTKESSNRLSFYLRELDDEIARNNTRKNDRLSRMSMIVMDEQDEHEEEDPDDEPLNGNSWGTLDENDDREDDTELTSLDNKTKSQLLDNSSNVMPNSATTHGDNDEDELFFVDKSNADLNTSSFYPNNSENQGDDPVKDSFVTNYSEDLTKNQVINKLPEIPGSPEADANRNRSNTNGTFEIFEDAVRKSKQEFESPEKQKLEVEKQRKPLKDSNDEDKYIAGSNKRKSLFFRNLSSGQPLPETSAAPTAKQHRRKSSFGDTLKSLFTSQSLSKPVTFETILTTDDGFEAVKSLLQGWKTYGIGNLNIDKSHNKIEASLLKANSLNLKPIKFSCSVVPSGKGMSRLVYRHTKGSSKSFDEIIKATRRILINEDVLC